MTKYRMRIYRPGGKLWITKDVFAEDDESAKQLAQQNFDELAAELVNQKNPKLDDPRLERFGLYDGDRLVCEIVRSNSLV